MDKIRQTADCMYHKFFRINRHSFDGKSDDIAAFLLAVLCFGTMYVSITNIGI